MNDTPQGDGNSQSLYLAYKNIVANKIRMNDTL